MCPEELVFLLSFPYPVHQDYQKAHELMEELGILHLKDCLLDEVSGGGVADGLCCPCFNSGC